MTIEELLDLPPESLEGITDAQHKDFFSPYLKFIKPTEEEKAAQHMFSLTAKPKRDVDRTVEESQKLVQRIAKQLGIQP